ncbi:hypothetical protein LSAT2_028770 [Lamellibrachia satsuma]|nr:hypothetical protein LSAT2_028770 [Lamellibrachia satsuma]
MIVYTAFWVTGLHQSSHSLRLPGHIHSIIVCVVIHLSEVGADWLDFFGDGGFSNCGVTQEKFQEFFMKCPRLKNKYGRAPPRGVSTINSDVMKQSGRNKIKGVSGHLTDAHWIHPCKINPSLSVLGEDNAILLRVYQRTVNMQQLDQFRYVTVRPSRGHSSVGSSGSSSEDSMERHDIQTAVRRNLRNWAQWRTEINDSLVKTMTTGQSMDNVAPLRTYLKGSRPHATDNPKTLLAYSAALDNISQLHRTTFLSYGIPRVKMPTGRVPSIAEPSPDYPEDDNQRCDDYYDDNCHVIYEDYDDVVPSSRRHYAMSGKTASGDRYEQSSSSQNQ